VKSGVNIYESRHRSLTTHSGGSRCKKADICFCPLIALSSIPSILAQNAETTGDKNAHHIVVPITTKSLAGVVSGDPSKPGAQFVIRMYNDANFIVLPHWHPEDEHVTVVKGHLVFG
jgi:hypothetical protein